MPRQRDPSDHDDLVRYLVRLVRPLSPETTEAQWMTFMVEARAAFGGRRYYIAKRQRQETPAGTRNASG